MFVLDRILRNFLGLWLVPARRAARTNVGVGNFFQHNKPASLTVTLEKITLNSALERKNLKGGNVK
jgi:hypothetical protein